MAASTFSFDLLLDSSNDGPGDDVIFSNGSTTLVYLFPVQPASGAWATETLTLNASDPNWHLNSYTGAAPSQSDFNNVLDSLSSIEISADYHTGSETVSLDNVLLHVTPEPTSMLAAVSVALSLLRRRRV